MPFFRAEGFPGEIEKSNFEGVTSGPIILQGGIDKSLFQEK